MALGPYLECEYSLKTEQSIEATVFENTLESDIESESA